MKPGGPQEDDISGFQYTILEDRVVLDVGIFMGFDVHLLSSNLLFRRRFRKQVLSSVKKKGAGQKKIEHRKRGKERK